MQAQSVSYGSQNAWFHSYKHSYNLNRTKKYLLMPFLPFVPIWTGEKLLLNESLVKDEIKMHPTAFASGNLDIHVKVM